MDIRDLIHVLRHPLSIRPLRGYCDSAGVSRNGEEIGLKLILILKIK